MVTYLDERCPRCGRYYTDSYLCGCITSDFAISARFTEEELIRRIDQEVGTDPRRVANPLYKAKEEE